MGKNVKKILELTNDDLSFIESYKELRNLLRDEGFTEETIKKISSGSSKLWSQFNLVQNEIFNLKSKLMKFWSVTDDEFKTYILNKMNEINQLIPLNDGDIK
jgi:hypothetical protein